MQKNNDPLRWLVAPACFGITITLLVPIVVALTRPMDGKESVGGLLATQLIVAYLGLLASLYLVAALLLSRLSVLIQAVESIGSKNAPLIEMTADEAVSESAAEIPAAPGILYRRTKLRSMFGPDTPVPTKPKRTS